MIIKTYIECLNVFNNSKSCILYSCCISCTQLTRTVLVATVKDVFWEMMYLVLSFYQST